MFVRGQDSPSSSIPHKLGVWREHACARVDQYKCVWAHVSSFSLKAARSAAGLRMGFLCQRGLFVQFYSQESLIKLKLLKCASDNVKHLNNVVQI